MTQPLRTDRRTFLAAAGVGAAALALGGGGRAAAQASRDGTWLTYAVNVEMFWTDLPFLDRLRRVADAGFSHYEFWPWKGKDIDAIAKLNDDLGLVPAQFSAFWGITSPEKRQPFVDAVKGAVEVAERLKVRKLTVVAGEVTPGLSPEAQTRAVVDNLKAGAEVAAPRGIMLILEPLNVLVDHPNQHVITSKHAAEILRKVDSDHVKMLFDVYHQQISEGNLTGNIRQYHDLIGYYQIADHPGRNEPGTGEIHYAHVLRTIHDVGYDGPIGLELRPREDPDDALAAVRKADAEARARAKA